MDLVHMAIHALYKHLMKDKHKYMYVTPQAASKHPRSSWVVLILLIYTHTDKRTPL